MNGAQKRYLAFYWPLALTSLMLLLESQFQNGILARYPDGPAQLAAFALAVSSFQLLNAFLIFVPQTVTILGRCPQSRRTCRRFIIGAGLLLSFPMFTMGYLPFGSRMFARLMHIPPELLTQVLQYLRWLAPLVLVNAMRHYYTGVLIRLGRTGVITLLNLAHLGSLVTILLLGFNRGWSPLATLAGATIISNLLHLGLIAPIAAEKRIGDRQASLRALTHREILAFFWPVAITSGMFALCRPIMYSFINRTAMAVTTVAALRVAFDVTMFFQNPVNQFRHLYTTFGAEDPEGVQRFMQQVTLVLTIAMLILAFSPLGHLLFRDALGLTGDVLIQALHALRVLCLAPMTIAVRNLYHGRMMVARRTQGMAAAGVFRVLAIALMSWLMFRVGWLNHIASALILWTGFIAEALVARSAEHRMAGRRKTRKTRKKTNSHT